MKDDLYIVCNLVSLASLKNGVPSGGMGMVTTHDLALAHIPESMNGSAQKYHFEDHLENGQLIFDFKLKAGVVETSNALKLMQSIGLLGD